MHQKRTTIFTVVQPHSDSFVSRLIYLLEIKKKTKRKVRKGALIVLGVGRPYETDSKKKHGPPPITIASRI
jgi:hypothetical protein